MIRKWILTLGLAAIFGVCGQDVLTNDGVVKLVRAGLSEDLIVNILKTRPSRFSLNADDVVELKKGGVPDKVLAAMIQKGVSSPAGAPGPTNAPLAPDQISPAKSAQTPVSEVGIYYKSNGQWEDVLPEIVTWQNWYMLVQGKSSRTKITGSAEFLIYAPEGVAVTEYQLLQLKERPTRREFMSFGGEVRNAVPFEGKKIASRTFLITLTSLSPGEYAFMPPGAAQARNSGGSLGKIYTFQLSH